MINFRSIWRGKIHHSNNRNSKEFENQSNFTYAKNEINVILIHGAYHSDTTFECLRVCLPKFNYINLNWNANDDFNSNLNKMKELLHSCNVPVYIIGHSMGGIYGVHLSQHLKCVGGSTIATPWGGSKHADITRFMLPWHPLYHEISTKSPVIRNAQTLNLPGQWTNYVSTYGNIPYIKEPNDCVLTIKSMTARKDIFTKYIDSTHHEIVMNPIVIKSISDDLRRLSKNISL